MPERPLRLTSLMSPLVDPFYEELAAYLTRAGPRAIEFVPAHPWQEGQDRLLAGDLDLGVVCGCQYVNETDAGEGRYRLLVSSVMAAARYDDAPIYFSDVFVRADSPARTFADLRGSRWVFNEPTSHSGHQVVLWKLATMGEDQGFFGEVREVGSHNAGLTAVLAGEADCVSVDTTVFAHERARRPELDAGLRVVETLGPSPAPPLIATAACPRDVDAALTATLLAMHEDPAGRAVLALAFQDRWVAVDDPGYQPLRVMRDLAAPIR